MKLFVDEEPCYTRPMLMHVIDGLNSNWRMSREMIHSVVSQLHPLTIAIALGLYLRACCSRPGAYGLSRPTSSASEPQDLDRE